MARRLQADRPSHRPLAPAGDRLAGLLGHQQQRGGQHRHPLDRGHPVGGRAASTSVPGQRTRAAPGTRRRPPPPAGDWLPGRGRAATSRCCDLKGVGHLGQHDGMASEAAASTGPRNPKTRARTAPSSERADRVRDGHSITPARVARRQGPAPAAGRCRCPGRVSTAPTGPGGSVRGQRPWEPHLEDGDPRTWAVSLWPTRIRQRMGVGWEARVLM